MCLKLTIKIPKQPPSHFSGVFLINFERIFTLCSSASIVNFEHVIAGCALPNLGISLQFRFISQELSSHHCFIAMKFFNLGL